MFKLDQFIIDSITVRYARGRISNLIYAIKHMNKDEGAVVLAVIGTAIFVIVSLGLVSLLDL